VKEAVQNRKNHFVPTIKMPVTEKGFDMTQATTVADGDWPGADDWCSIALNVNGQQRVTNAGAVERPN
jgi:hypothetical protein